MPEILRSTDNSDMTLPRESIWKRLTRLFRSGPVVRHKIAAGEKLVEPAGTAKAFKKELSSLYVHSLASYGQYERLSRYADYCLVGDTNIAVPYKEGCMTIEEIVSRFSFGETLHVFSYDSGSVCCSKIENAWMTGEREIWEVKLDDGTIIECTDNQPFMLRDGTYKRADELTCETALMPFNRKDFNGYDGFKDFVKRYTNHKVVSVMKTGKIEKVYDITVENQHNFAICDKKGNGVIYLHNSEMEFTPEIASALDIYADEATAYNEDNAVVDIISKNPEIKQILETLFFEILNIEFNAWSWTRNLCKYGDFILFVDASEQNGILNLMPIPINEIEREEGYDKNDPYAVRYRWLTQGNLILQAWQIIHFRLLGNDNFLPYGSSIIEPARRIWRQLILIEDAMLVYRIIRSPERRVFYIDVGNIPPDQIDQFMEKVKTTLRRNSVVDPTTGRVDLRYNPLSVDEDYFIPIRGDKSSRIETLAGGQFTGDIDDVQYIQSKLFAALKVPKAYLGYEAELGSKATLSQQDVRFARTIERVQKILIAELQKIAIVHLFLLGYTGEDLVDFEIKMANPSTIAEQQKLELWRTKFEIAGSAQEGMTDKETIWKRIFGLNDEEIDKIREGMRADKLEQLTLEAMQAPIGEAPPEEKVPGEEELPTTLGGAPEGEAGGEAPPAEEPPPPPTENVERMTDEVKNKGSEGNKAEISVSKGKDLFSPDEDLSKHVYGTEKQTASDPNDMRYLRRLVSRPFSESIEKKLLEGVDDVSSIDDYIKKTFAETKKLLKKI